MFCNLSNVLSCQCSGVCW